MYVANMNFGRIRYKRITFSAEQLAILENTYHKYQYPTKEQRTELSHYISVDERRITTWFQNRRNKSKPDYRKPKSNWGKKKDAEKRRRQQRDEASKISTLKPTERSTSPSCSDQIPKIEKDVYFFVPGAEGSENNIMDLTDKTSDYRPLPSQDPLQFSESCSFPSQPQANFQWFYDQNPALFGYKDYTGDCFPYDYNWPYSNWMPNTENDLILKRQNDNKSAYTEQNYNTEDAKVPDIDFTNNF